MLLDLIAHHRVVLVSATAGAGKTTAAADAARAAHRPVAWLRLDETDVVPGRLILYLQAAVRRALPSVPAIVEDALAARIEHAEAAAALAEAVGTLPLILVLDEMERLTGHPAALAVIGGFVRYAASTTTVVMLSRHDVEFDGLDRMRPSEEVGHLDEDALAFTIEEAERALALRGTKSVDAAGAVAATGGWVSGVLFEAWRSPRHIRGAGGDADALNGYLSAEILQDLDPDDRNFLIATSLLDAVDPNGADALGIDEPDKRLARLRVHHLPAVWEQGGAAIRCHPRFRDYLRSRLDAWPPDKRRELRRRHALMLTDQGRDEEAVEELLLAQATGDAARVAARALPAVIARLDLDLAERWLSRLAHDQPLGPELIAAKLTLAVGRERFDEAVEAADDLQRKHPAVAARHSGLIAWSYWHAGRVEDARRLLEGRSGRDTEIVRHLFSLMDPHPAAADPQPTGGPLDALILRIAYARGRLREVRDWRRSGWLVAASERSAACRALGELEQTQRLLAEAGRGVIRLSNLRSEGTVAAELAIDLGREQDARAALAAGAVRIARSGSVLFDMLERLLAAKLELRLARDGRKALEILAGLEALDCLPAYGYVAEQLELWAGYALLLQQNDQLALRRLRRAVDSMRSADRILELPTAGIYLSEAEWRLGSEEAASFAADVALQAADRQGSRHLLLQAIADVPGVLARRFEDERSPDGPWHDVARALALRDRAPWRSPQARVSVQDFGVPSITVDGHAEHFRIARVAVALGYLAVAGGPVTRTELLDALFDGRGDDSAKAYLRQVLHGVRNVIPAGTQLQVAGDTIALPRALTVETDSMRLCARLAEAGGLRSELRVAAVTRALAPAEKGAIFEGVECAWVHARRAEMDHIVTEARIDLAVAHYETGAFAKAERVLERVVAENPFRERAWRMLIRVAAGEGRVDDVIEIYRRCVSALQEAGLEPSAWTTELLAGLRR
jgi:DNA-binding SARP family transcriptional activator